jgi:hypothetical protein
VASSQERVPIDDARILPRFRARQSEPLPLRSEGAPPASFSSSSSAISKLPGDPWALRGFPVVSRDGLGGAIAGTQPEDWLLRHDPFGDET